MSTEIITIQEKEERASHFNTNISATRFAGKKGPMLQVTIAKGLDFHNIFLTKKQVKKLSKALKNSFNYDKF